MNMGIAGGDFRLPALAGLPAEGDAATLDVARQQPPDKLPLPEQARVVGSKGVALIRRCFDYPEFS
jgi:hypothetical protein